MAKMSTVSIIKRINLLEARERPLKNLREYDTLKEVQDELKTLYKELKSRRISSFTDFENPIRRGQK